MRETLLGYVSGARYEALIETEKPVDVPDAPEDEQPEPEDDPVPEGDE